jgi:cytochrome c-type biogenesis protein CcmH/NrfF
VDLRGDWVLADPGNEEGNYWSWLLPLGALGVAAPLIFWKVRGWVQVTQERERKAATAPEESAQEDAEYKDMLRKELAEL